MFFNEPFGGIIPGARGAVLAALLRTDTPLTGRQIHRLLSDDYSLWTVQEALKSLSKLGLVETQTIGRAGVHTINEEHASVAPLRTLLDPVAALREAVSAVTDGDVQAVLLFGSIARGEATPDSLRWLPQSTAGTSSNRMPALQPRRPAGSGGQVRPARRLQAPLDDRLRGGSQGRASTGLSG
jgi:hypothetical protein